MAVNAPVANNCGVNEKGENQMNEGACAGLPPYSINAPMISAKMTAVSIPVKINCA